MRCPITSPELPPDTDHLNDQLAVLAWLRTQAFVQKERIAVAGNSFGGIETVLGAERGRYCAAIDSAGGAQSWAEAPELDDHTFGYFGASVWANDVFHFLNQHCAKS
jgi:dienelactone hydrolase